MGWFTIACLFLIFLVKFCSLLFVQNIGFFKMQPTFTSINNDNSTTLENYCSNSSQVQIDWNSALTLNNYVIKYDLLCSETKSQIMFLGMCLKIGFFLYLIFVSHTIDTLGRLRAFTIGMIVYILTLCAVIATPQAPRHSDSP